MSDNKAEYYAATVNAWYSTKLEHDKSLMSLSAGAIGLLITLLMTVGTNFPIGILVILLSSMACFIVCLFAVLSIFEKNGAYLENLIQHNKKVDSSLSVLDRRSVHSFKIGVVLALIVGIYIAITSVLSTEPSMTEKKEGGAPTRKTLIESFDGANKIAPKSPRQVKHSFDGAEKVAPQPTQEKETSESKEPAPQPEKTDNN